MTLTLATSDIPAALSDRAADYARMESALAWLAENWRERGRLLRPGFLRRRGRRGLLWFHDRQLCFVF